MRFVFLVLMCFLGGCASFNGLEPMCQQADEASLAATYADNGIDVRNFDTFANQCSKYGYRVPSKEKFTESYNKLKQSSCLDSTTYFKASYKAYKAGGKIDECQVIGQNQFDSKAVKEDAWSAHHLVKTIRELDTKITDAQDNNGKKQYDSGFILDSLLRAAYEDNPVSLEEKREARTQELKAITKKYNVFVSEL